MTSPKNRVDLRECRDIRQAGLAGGAKASRISRVISSEWEISERWLAFTSVVLAPRLRVIRSGLHFVRRVCVAARYADVNFMALADRQRRRGDGGFERGF